MARPKEFDRDTALQEAIKVFSNHGYDGASTEALLNAMRIGRQSLYDTFGDKRALYLEALQRYSADSVADILRTLNSARSPLKGVETALLAFASRPAMEAGLGCLGVSAICEFGRSDPEIALLNDASGRTLASALERLIAEAKEAGEIAAEIDDKAAVQFIGATLFGMKVSARNGASPDALRNIARMAIRSLK